MSYSSSGIYQFPTLTDAALQRKDSQYATRVLGWLSDAVIEGDSINTSDPNYDKIAQGMRYVSGDQVPGGDASTPPYMEPMVFNFASKALKAHASALTDLKPTFGWRSLNPKYQMHAQQLNLLAIAWWLNQQADLSFGDVVKLAWTAGTGDMMIEWNPGLPGGGDHSVIPKDPRDTLPWRPGRYGDEQTWQGAIFREIWSVNTLREKYPYAAAAITTTDDSLLGSIKGIFFRKPQQFQTPADPLSNLGGGARGMAGPARSGDCVLYRAYLDDRTRNLTARPIVMGEKSFQYIVEPGGFMYPTKRLLVSTQDLILYDGPNPYWHGKFPFARLHLWKLPWSFLGQAALGDLAPVQNAINLSGKHMKMGIEQWMDRQVVLDRSAVSEATSRAYDSRKPGFTFKLKTSVVDPTKVVTKLEGPNPQVLAQNFQWFEKLVQTFESLAGTGNLEALLQMRGQLPAGDTLEKYQEMLTPELRMEGRMMESFLRRASGQICYNTFQFMDSARRIAILGDAGLLLEDFDFEPDSLVPAMDQTIEQMVPGPAGMPMPMQVPNPNYDKTFDRNLPRAQRAQAMAKLMVFVVAPNSVLAFNAQAEKMMRFQLARMGYYDCWSLAETLEIPNFGAPPPIPLPPLPPIPPEMMGDPVALAQLLVNNVGKYVMGPDGSILELRVPVTVVERLQAQMMLGIGMTEGTSGRKASGGDSPKQEEKSDGQGGSRQTITESKK